MCVGGVVLNAYTGWRVLASVRVRWLPRVWADHSSIAHSPQQTTWGSSAPLKPTPPTLSCSKRPHLTSGRCCFPRCCCFPMTLLLKQRIQTWPPGSAGRRYRRTLYDLMKGISAAFWSLSDVCFREPPSPCWRQCSLKSLLLFVCWKHNAKANDVKLKAWMSDLEGQAETWWLLCCIALCCTEDVFSLCACLWIVGHCHTSLYIELHWVSALTVHSCYGPKTFTFHSHAGFLTVAHPQTDTSHPQLSDATVPIRSSSLRDSWHV